MKCKLQKTSSVLVILTTDDPFFFVVVGGVIMTLSLFKLLLSGVGKAKSSGELAHRLEMLPSLSLRREEVSWSSQDHWNSAVVSNDGGGLTKLKCC